MLSGNNGILQRATDAKTQTGIGQEKEIVALAYNSALAKKVGNGDSAAVTAGDLNTELANQGANADGVDPIIVTFEKSGRKYEIDNDGKIIAEDEVEPTGVIGLTLNEIMTESRVVILEVTVDGVTTVEEWLRTFSIEELTEMYARVMTHGSATWAQTMGQSGFADVKDFYEKTQQSSGKYTDVYNYMANGTNYVDMDAYNATYKNTTIKCNGETITVADKGNFVIPINGSYKVTATDTEGKKGTATANITKCKVEKYSSKVGTNTVKNIDGYKVTIPAGFAYGTSENVGHVSTGLVITDEVDKDGNSIGNEFVWIPISYYESTDAITVGNTGKLMATIKSGTNYRGVLYNWESDKTGNTTYAWNTNSYHEPGIVSMDTKNEYSSYGVTESTLQTEYNTMIASVKKNGGFYVGRYEIGQNGISKLGDTPASEGDNTQMAWYGLYERAKGYTKSSITSSMIWGSQYDAMLNFALTNTADKNKIVATTNGNHGESAIKTGLYQGSDSINNIYDLEGNLLELTLEAGEADSLGSKSRTFRGGSIFITDAPWYRPGSGSLGVYKITGSRSTLYIR